ncbi:MAG: hypothetical protein GX299_02955 [Epulopiscium sp.]|nr:hypothetical protein [Candidatus Epulonipiscium sp.]
MNIELKELIQTVKDELLCYENMEPAAAQWEKEFLAWLNLPENKKNIIRKGNSQYFKIKDEEEIFEIANSYIDAMEENTIKNYWKSF